MKYDIDYVLSLVDLSASYALEAKMDGLNDRAAHNFATEIMSVHLTTGYREAESGKTRKAMRDVVRARHGVTVTTNTYD